MSNNAAWKSELQQLLDQHNERHARRAKNVSYKTQEERAQILFLVFKQLRRLGFQPAPENLNGDHVQTLVDFWTGNERLAKRCHERGLTLPQEPLSPATLQARLSTLRVFCEWIGKPGMVLPPERYVSDPALVKRSYVAQEDKSWTAKGLDPAEIIARVAKIDGRVAAMVELVFHFGLRKKEAAMLAPHCAVVPAVLLPNAHPGVDAYLLCLAGTKGGRLRFVPIDTPAKRGVIEHAKQVARHRFSHLGHPDHSLQQTLKRISYVMTKVGVTKRDLKVTLHGLRHQFANDLYVLLTDTPSPVRGGEPSNLARHVMACLEVARQLGHERIEISRAYCGAPKKRTLASE